MSTRTKRDNATWPWVIAIRLKKWGHLAGVSNAMTRRRDDVDRWLQVMRRRVPPGGASFGFGVLLGKETACAYRWLTEYIFPESARSHHRQLALSDIHHLGPSAMLCEDLGLTVARLCTTVTNVYNGSDFREPEDHTVLANVITAAVHEQRRLDALDPRNCP